MNRKRNLIHGAFYNITGVETMYFIYKSFLSSAIKM